MKCTKQIWRIGETYNLQTKEREKKQERQKNEKPRKPSIWERRGLSKIVGARARACMCASTGQKPIAHDMVFPVNRPSLFQNLFWHFRNGSVTSTNARQFVFLALCWRLIFFFALFYQFTIHHFTFSLPIFFAPARYDR